MSASRCEMLRDGEGYKSEASYDAKRSDVEGRSQYRTSQTKLRDFSTKSYYDIQEVEVLLQLNY